MSTPAKSGLLEGLTPSVTLASLAIVLAVTLLGAVQGEPFGRALQEARTALTPFLESWYVALVTAVLAFVIWLGVGRYKNVRLGGDDERPELSTFSWITMLFAAGMGVGLIFWSVAEPISHLGGNPFVVEGGPRSAADVAMRLTFFHWGLHGWALFSLVAIVIGYFGFRYKLPLTMRSALYPLLGKRIFGPAGDIMDTFTVVATVFGVVTTVGLGVQQLNAGLGAVAGVAMSIPVQAVLTFVVMAVAVAALLVGLDRGLRLLSELNFWLSVTLVAIFLALGPTTHLMALAVQTTGDYLHHLVYQSFWTAANQPGDWHAIWTVFYWGWWMAWSPFVGLFIARISRGRQLREFVMGVLLAPVIISFVWLAVLGGTGLHLEREAAAGIAEVVARDVAAAFYHTVAALDAGVLGLATAVLVTVLIGFYLITSASAGVLVVDTLLAFGGQRHKPGHHVLWGVVIALLTAVLLAAGGVESLQQAVILASLPFSLGLVAMMIGLVRALEEEVFGPRKGRRSCLPAEPWAPQPAD
jgi:choline/glycine/proline betaine transport protein